MQAHLQQSFALKGSVNNFFGNIVLINANLIGVLIWLISKPNVWLPQWSQPKPRLVDLKSTTTCICDEVINTWAVSTRYQSVDDCIEC
jgi:hypothetical protein